jgi:hypothetical protein
LRHNCRLAGQGVQRPSHQLAASMLCMHTVESLQRSCCINALCLSMLLSLQLLPSGSIHITSHASFCVFCCTRHHLLKCWHLRGLPRTQLTVSRQAARAQQP